MSICALFIVATSLAYVTPTCVVDKNTMVEPAALTYVYDINELPAVELIRSPQVYADYWRMFGAKPGGTWNPDKYIKITSRGAVIVHEPWRKPEVRVKYRHYEKYRNYLNARRGPDAVAKWEATRSPRRTVITTPSTRRLVPRATTRRVHRRGSNRTAKRVVRKSQKKRAKIRSRKKNRRSYR